MASADQSIQMNSEAAVQRISVWGQIKINLFWFANNFHWIALLNVVIPAQVAVYFGASHKDLNLPLVVVWGTLVAFAVNPLTGSISDYVRTRLGRRRPFMIAGATMNVIILLCFALVGQSFIQTPFTHPSIAVMALLFVLLQFSNNISNAPWSAIIADQVPKQQRGAASGWYGLMTLFGTIAGFVVAGMIVNYGNNQQITSAYLQTFAHETFIFYVTLAAVQAIFVFITVISVHETLPQTVIPFRAKEFWSRFKLETKKYPDFTWVLITRLMVMTGIWSINTFLLYYFTDVLKDSAASSDVSFKFFPIVLGTSLITTMLGGALSDKFGRKIMVYLSGAMMTVTCIMFIVASNLSVSVAFGAALAAAGFFGLGYGAYTSVDWALATDVLPPVDQYGKDMGIWTAMGIIPQVIGAVLGGAILFFLQNSGLTPNISYSILFSVSVILFALGTLFVSKIKGAR